MLCIEQGVQHSISVRSSLRASGTLRLCFRKMQTCLPVQRHAVAPSVGFDIPIDAAHKDSAARVAKRAAHEPECKAEDAHVPEQQVCKGQQRVKVVGYLGMGIRCIAMSAKQLAHVK